MFIGHSRVLDLPIEAAQPRLVNLAGCGSISACAAAAYSAGISRALRVGPFGDVPGAAKLVRVQFLEPAQHADRMALPMRWEAVGAAGRLFPVLDADLSLTRESQATTRLALMGSYRPPLGWLGAGLDRALLRRVATATVRALLRDIATALAQPSSPDSLTREARELGAPGTQQPRADGVLGA